MKLMRHGPKGAEKPALVDAAGQVRDLSGVLADVGPTTLTPASLAPESAASDKAAPPDAEEVASPMDILLKLEIAGAQAQMEQWILVDQSATGIGAIAPAVLSRHRIGVLVCVRESDRTDWRLGLIRRIGRDSANRPRFGREALAWPSICAMAKPVGEESAWARSRRLRRRWLVRCDHRQPRWQPDRPARRDLRRSDAGRCAQRSRTLAGAARHPARPRIINLDDQRKSVQSILDEKLAESNNLAKIIGDLYKSGQTEEANHNKIKVAELKEITKELETELHSIKNMLRRQALCRTESSTQLSTFG